MGLKFMISTCISIQKNVKSEDYFLKASRKKTYLIHREFEAGIK